MRVQKFLVILFLISFKSFALVDYSDAVSTSTPGSSRTTGNVSQIKANTKEQSSFKGGFGFDFQTSYSSNSIEGGKYSAMHFDLELNTPYSVYSIFRYWQAQADTKLGFSKSSQSGNPEFILGFNWLKFGNSQDLAVINLYGGAKMKSQSELGSSHTDQIFGIETSKQFNMLALGLSYEVRLSGISQQATQMNIGNQQIITAGLSWVVSSDIHIQLESKFYTIKKSSEGDLHLNQDITFSTLNPTLGLTLFPSVEWQLGAVFPTKKANSKQNLYQARLYDLPGAYGTSLYSGLSLGI